MILAADAQVLDSLIGRTLLGWHQGEGGMHFELDDGRTVILLGSLAVIHTDAVVH